MGGQNKRCSAPPLYPVVPRDNRTVRLDTSPHALRRLAGNGARWETLAESEAVTVVAMHTSGYVDVKSQRGQFRVFSACIDRRWIREPG